MHVRLFEKLHLLREELYSFDTAKVRHKGYKCRLAFLSILKGDIEKIQLRAVLVGFSFISTNTPMVDKQEWCFSQSALQAIAAVIVCIIASISVIKKIKKKRERKKGKGSKNTEKIQYAIFFRG